MRADLIEVFKIVRRLSSIMDRFWLNQEVIFNYKVDLAGTANRSIIN